MDCCGVDCGVVCSLSTVKSIQLNDHIASTTLLRIPVYMHNVDSEKVFRTSAWNNFGTADLESADFRACSTYGLIYR